MFGVRGLTTWGEIGLIGPRLSDDANELKRNRAALYARCGREWVATETRGVLIAVVYTVKNVSQSERSRLEAAVSGGFNGTAFKINASASLEKIFSKAFLSNYYSMRVHAVGGNGVSRFGDSLQSVEQPDTIIQQISEYMKELKYGQSVPISFTTGSIDQFLASGDENFNFDSYNRRIAELFLAYEEYKTRRQQLWRFVNDDLQAYWGTGLDGSAWERLVGYDNALTAIEGTARLCRSAAMYAGNLSARRPLTAAGSVDPPDGAGRAQRGGSNAAPGNRASPLGTEEAAFLRRFTVGAGHNTNDQATAILQSLASLQRLTASPNAPTTPGIPAAAETPAAPETPAAAVTLAASGNDPQPPCREPGNTPLAEAERSQCECQRYNKDLYVRTRFPIMSTPSVEVFHEIEAFKPGSLVVLSVASAAGLVSVELFDNTKAKKLTLEGGYDPDRGPVWYGSFVYRDGHGKPPSPDTLPYVLHIKDKLGREFRKPVVVKD